MLVLKRKLNERIRIGEDVWVQVVEVYGDAVKLGVTAPRDMPVHREEVDARIRAAREIPRDEGDE